MGKNTNQIATFGDLKNLGYRWPSAMLGNPSDNHCVTTSDIYTLHHNTTGYYYWEYTSPALTWSTNNNKAMKWSDIPGAAGQTPNIDNAYKQAHNMVKCVIKESVVGKTNASTITFYYNFKESGSTVWQKLAVSQCELGSGGKVDSSADTLGYLVINPVIIKNTTGLPCSISDDYLSIKCGDTSSKQTWSYYLSFSYLQNLGTVWTQISGTSESCEITVGSTSGLNYTDSIRTLEEVGFKVT